MIRLALIGAGSHAVDQHLPAILTCPGEASVTVVCDRDAARAAAVAGPLGARAVTVWQEALALPVDAVIVCTRPELTPDIALAAMERRLPVLVEKPLALDLATAERLCAGLAGHPAMASMNRRFDPAFRRLGAFASGRTAHAWRGVLARRGRSEPEFLAYTGVHLVDLMIHLAGPPDATGCRCEAVQGGRRILWRTAGGAEVAAEVRPTLGIDREAVEASGDGWHAEARSAWFDDGLVRLREAGSAPAGESVDPLWPVWRRNGTDAETTAFIAACAGRGPWSPHPSEVLLATRICAEAMRQL